MQIQPRKDEKTIILFNGKPSKELLKRLEPDPEAAKKRRNELIAKGLFGGFLVFIGSELVSFHKYGPGHSYIFSKIGDWFFH